MIAEVKERRLVIRISVRLAMGRRLTKRRRLSRSKLIREHQMVRSMSSMVKLMNSQESNQAM